MDVQRSIELQAIRGQSVPLTRDETVDSETQVGLTSPTKLTTLTAATALSKTICCHGASQVLSELIDLWLIGASY